MAVEIITKTGILVEDIKFWDMGYTLVGGVDEVGRGPLAGPVVAACVILPKEVLIEGIVDSSFVIRDSKRLSPLRRERLYDVIMSKAIAVGIGRVEPEEIDRINILNAARKAMEQAVLACHPSPDCLLIDALELESCSIPQFSLVKGDVRSQAIAAASIIAKVTRDREMVRWAEVYPQYGFEKHKGYGTKQHIESIKKFGLSPIHRRTFCEKFVS
ncbi:MAG: ribonuclease HII [Clostridia bacterium]|nr:ribonuclease HII [Clostridia bacterium]